MRNNLFTPSALAFALLAPALALAQSAAQTHDGFFLSISPGIAFGESEADLTEAAGSWDNVTYSGPGGILDLKIGGAIAPNFILSGDFIGRSVRGPKVETFGGTDQADNDVVLADGTLGVGVTYYVMPANVFLSGTIGVGRLVLTNPTEDADDDERIETNPGLSIHAKAGKEWWVSDNWGLGVAAGYGWIGAERDENSEADFNGKYTSHKFYVLLNTTFN
jgi:hypothetical protein